MKGSMITSLEILEGLTERHLGCSLQEMEPHLKELNRRYGVHMCGEGGEYETFTLDCPLFTHRIVIDESEVRLVTSDEVAPVAYMRLNRLHLEKKDPCLQRPLPPALETKVVIPPQIASCQVASCQVVCCPGGSSTERRAWQWGIFEGKGEGISEQTHHVFSELSGWLEGHGGQWTDLAIIHLYLSNMDNYSLVNAVYGTFFPSQPPARVCVQLTLPIGVLVKMEVLLLCQRPGEGEGLVTMHVQSLSHWAPANIGPYSQAVRGGKVVFIAGQIGLHPSNMTLAPPPNQPSISLTHTTAVLEANRANLGSTLCGICYFTTEEAGWTARMTWREHLQRFGGRGPAVVFLRVPALPRGACVEWSFICLTSSCQLQYQSLCKVMEGVGMVSSEAVMWYGRERVSGGGPIAGAWLVILTPLPIPLVSMSDAVKVCVQQLSHQLSAAGASINDVSLLQYFLPCYSSSSPLSYEELSAASGAGVVTVTSCEGYFGQNCSISLLALLLSPSLLTEDNVP